MLNLLFRMSRKEWAAMRKLMKQIAQACKQRDINAGNHEFRFIIEFDEPVSNNPDYVLFYQVCLANDIHIKLWGHQEKGWLSAHTVTLRRKLTPSRNQV